MKRGFDAVWGMLLLLLLLPLGALIALVIRIAMGSPVFFRQTRAGLSGKPFRILKFRTMSLGDGPDAVRLTKLGRLLRSTSLDELPELWNVLRGEMSLVGPRPLLVEYLPLYSSEQARRHEVLPGLTGWAQIRGRNALSWDERFRLDVWYVDHRSFALDLRILLMTLVVVLGRKNIRAEGQDTMPPFRGTSAS
jgi:lipopolysaccharide/colanic/teichoic acid biosynthesis glycosyltransferase